MWKQDEAAQPGSIPLTSATLIRGAAAKDNTSLTRLVDLYSPYINAKFKKLSVPAHEWAGLRNEVWVKLITWLPEFQGERVGAFRRALLTFAHRVASNYWRGLRAAGETLSDDDAALGKAAEEEFRDLRDSLDIEETVRALLAEFSRTAPRNSPEILRLSMEGYSAREIGDRVGLGEASVRQARKRAYDEIRTIAIDLYDDDPIIPKRDALNDSRDESTQ